MSRPILSFLRTLAVGSLGIAAAVGFAGMLDRVYPLKTWLFFDLLAIYGWQLLLTACCASFGHFVLTRVLGIRVFSGLETLAFSLPIGLVGFVLAMYMGGFLALYGPGFAVTMPLVLFAVGLPAGVRAWSSRSGSAGLRGSNLAVAMAGTVCLAFMYLEVISPDALNYDATWSHVVIGQDYAREGRIVPFLASWVKNVPHLASMVYTWDFLVPGPAIDSPLRWMMALHSEFVVFLWTLVGVSAATAWLAGEKVRAAWAAFFLFPGIFVYDHSLGGASDHVTALFAAPLFLATMRAARHFNRRLCCLVGILAAGGIATKLQAVYVIGPAGVFLAGRFAFLTIRRLRQDGAAPPVWHMVTGALLIAACAIVCAGPQFIENWIYFHNPVYPLAQRTFKESTPTMPGAAEMVDNLFADWHWRPPKELGARVLQAGRLAFSYSFDPHYSFIGQRPYFGSLFTLLLPLVPFLPRAGPLWAGVFVGLGSLFLWGFSYVVDRNLQTFLPILVAVTAATIARGWRMGWAARLGLASLIGMQIVWGADLIFSGNDRLQAGVALVKSGLDGYASDRFSGYRRAYRDLGAAMPHDGTAILHNSHLSLGINRRILLDWVGFQGLFDYRAMSTPRHAFDRFAALGVTHLITLPGSRTAASKQEEVIFDVFANEYASHVGTFGPFWLYEMPRTPPPEQRPFRVLALGIQGYADGIYPIERLGTCEEMPPALQKFGAPDARVTETSAVAAALDSVDSALINPSYHLNDDASNKLRQGFRPVASYASFALHSRTRPK